MQNVKGCLNCVELNSTASEWQDIIRDHQGYGTECAQPHLFLPSREQGASVRYEINQKEEEIVALEGSNFPG